MTEQEKGGQIIEHVWQTVMDLLKRSPVRNNREVSSEADIKIPKRMNFYFRDILLGELINLGPFRDVQVPDRSSIRGDQRFEAMGQLLKSNRNQAEIWYALGTDFAAIDEIDKAKLCLERALKINPDIDSKWSRTAYYYRKNYLGIPNDSTVANLIREVREDAK